MKQYKITSVDIIQSTDNDCYLGPNDPIHELKSISCLGGIGSEQALARYNQQALPVIGIDSRGQIQKDQSIIPGTKDWFDLWFNPKRHVDES